MRGPLIILRLVSAAVGVGLIHYAFMRHNPEAGFFGIMVLSLIGILTGPWPARLLFLVVGGASLLGALGYGEGKAESYLLLAAPVLLNLAAMTLFGGTLLPGQVPLITRFSRFDHLQSTGPLVDRHTRRLTALWTGFFAMIVVATLVLAALGHFLAASWVVTVVSPIGSAAFFLLEHLYRHFRRDLFGQASVFRTLRVIAHPDAWRGLQHDP